LDMICLPFIAGSLRTLFRGQGATGNGLLAHHLQ
jgi:hypothetical protein